MRAMRGQVGWSMAEIAAGQTEWREYVLLYVVLPRVAGEPLEGVRQVNPGGVGVTETTAGRKLDLLVRHHGDELLPRRRLKRLPVGTGRISPRRALKTGRVSEQHPNCDGIH